MLMPKRVKRRRVFRGRMKGKAQRGNFIAYGEYGLVATEPAWITSQQIEAARIALTRYTRRGGQGGAGVEALKKELEAFAGCAVALNIMEIKNPETDAQLVAENIAQQLERRISFRRAMKQSIQRAMKGGAKGIKTAVSGRLGGADIARSEGYHEGSIPLQTLRANIDYGFAEAKTTYGRLGVKVWIYKGQILPKNKKNPVRAEGGR